MKTYSIPLPLLLGLVSFYSLANTQEVVIQINSSTTVQLLVTDPKGRRTGQDFRRSTNRWKWETVNEIPHSNYSHMSVGSLDSTDSVEQSLEFVHHFNSPEGDGIFLVEVIGDELCAFDLSVDLDCSDDHLGSSGHYSLTSVPIDRDSIVTYQIVYRSGPDKYLDFRKLATTRSLLQDIAAMYKLKWISSARTFREYVAIVQNCQNHLQKAAIADARISLKGILRRIPVDSAQTITANACQVLRFEVESLMRGN